MEIKVELNGDFLTLIGTEGAEQSAYIPLCLVKEAIK